MLTYVWGGVMEDEWLKQEDWDVNSFQNSYCPFCGQHMTQKMADGRDPICTRCDCWWIFVGDKLCRCKDENGGWQKEYRRRADGIMPAE